MTADSFAAAWCEYQDARKRLRQAKEGVLNLLIPRIMGLADRLYVLASGRVIAEGPPAELRDDPRVVAAYLGTDERVIRRSGALGAPVG